MLEKKYSVADFAALVGTTSKTIYQKIGNYSNLPSDEQLKTVREKVKGREVTLISTSTDQIEYYKNLYSKSPVRDGEYYESLTDNDSLKPSVNTNNSAPDYNGAFSATDLYEKLLTLNNEFNDRLEQKNSELIQVNNELAEVRGRQLLLEDKASREGYYINENNKLETEINRYKLWVKILITVIVCFLLITTGFITYSIASKRVTNIPGAVSGSIVDFIGE